MKRNALIDNAKVILIFLVVFGHLIQPFTTDHKGVYTLYMWIYTFHMPAFIMLSGFFAKGSGNRNYIQTLMKKLLIPYLIFQGLYTVFFVTIGKSSWQMSLIQPKWGLWFLFSLFSWHVLLIAFKKFNPVWGIGIAIVLGLFAGYIPGLGAEFSLARTVVFFPFFLLGYTLKLEHLQIFKTHIWKISGALIALGLFAVIFYMPEFSSGWLLGSHPYVNLETPFSGGGTRLLTYVVSAVMVLSFMAFVPERQLIITALGKRTLYVYLLHGFFIHYARQQEIFQFENILDIFVLMTVAWALVILLSSRFILNLSSPLIELDSTGIRRMFKERTQSA